jgi:hypothetical protein
VYGLSGLDVFGCCWRKRVHRLFGWEVLGCDGFEQCDRLHELSLRGVFAGVGELVHGLSDQHIFRGVGVGLPGVSGERGVGGGERVAGILLLPEWIRACGRLVRVPDM